MARWIKTKAEGSEQPAWTYVEYSGEIKVPLGWVEKSRFSTLDVEPFRPSFYAFFKRGRDSMYIGEFNSLQEAKRAVETGLVV